MDSPNRERCWQLGLRKAAVALFPFWLLSVAPAFAVVQGDGVTLTQDLKAFGGGGTQVETQGHELEMFKTAEISLRQAMTIVARRRFGSRVIDISFDCESGASIYRVKTVKGNRVWEDALDAKTGDVIGPTVEFDSRDLQIDDRNNLQALRAVSLEISDAVPVAERTVRGRAISAGLTTADGRLNFLIVVVSDNGLKQVILEPPAAKRRRNRP
jgi:uncharacterized membrane protein YkoI